MTNISVEAPMKVGPVKLLAGFSREDQRDLLARGHRLEVALQESFMVAGERDLNLYLVLSGIVSAWRGGVKVTQLGAGDILNETKVFLPGPNELTAKAETPDTVVLCLPRTELLTYFRDRPERLLKVFVLNIVAILAKKLGDREESIVASLLPDMAMAEEV